MSHFRTLCEILSDQSESFRVAIYRGQIGLIISYPGKNDERNKHEIVIMAFIVDLIHSVLE